MKPERRLKEKQYNFTMTLIITLFAFLIIQVTKLPGWVLALLIMGLMWMLIIRLLRIRSELLRLGNQDMPKRG